MQDARCRACRLTQVRSDNMSQHSYEVWEYGQRMNDTQRQELALEPDVGLRNFIISSCTPPTPLMEKVYNAEMDGTRVEEYNDESILDSNNGYRSQITASGLKKNASLGDQPLWNSSPMRYCPPRLQGIQPVTREPWALDEDVYNRRFETRDVGIGACTGRT